MTQARLLVLALLTVGVVACGGAGDSRRIVNIVTAPPGGGWYVIGGVLASVINDAVPNVQANAEASGGAEENVRLVGTGQSDLGMVIHKTALQGYRGDAPFNQPFSNLRMLFANMEVGRMHVVLLRDSAIKDLCELKGKRVAVGPMGNGSLANLREILSSGCGFTFDDLTPIYLPYDQSLSALGDRRLDAVILYITPPIPALSEFGAMHEYRLLPISESIRDAVVKAYPFYVRISIAAKTYAPVTEDVPVLGTANGVMVNAELPEDLVYAITKATFENIERVRNSYPTLAGFSPEVAAREGLIPFHDGAIRYYREHGLWPESTSAEPANPAAQGTP